MSWIALVGAKGGSGATTLTWDLAKALADKGRVAAIDADFTGRRSLGVIAEATEEFDRARTGDKAAVAKVNGVTAVELTDSYDAALAVTPDVTEQLAASLDSGYALVYVDAAHPFAAASRPFMTRATRYLLLIPPTLLGVTGARATLNDMVRFGFPKDRIAGVMIWQFGRPEISRPELERTLGISVIAEIPPAGDRSRRRALDDLNATLLAIPSATPIDTLTSATPVLLGDRRKALRTAQPSHETVSAEHNGTARGIFQILQEDVNRIDEIAERRAHMKREIHAELGKRMDAMKGGNTPDAEMKQAVDDMVREIIAERKDTGDPEEAMQLRQEILDEALGLGPIEELLRDDAISEIMVNGANQVYVERSGQLTMSDVQFSSEHQLRQTIDRIITPLGRRIDEAQPMVDARLPDGSRVNAIIGPLAIDGASLTIRRFGKKRMGVADLVRFGALTEEMVEFVRACVEARLNILVSGGTGSGKTTLLNIISNFIPEGERIVTIEDAAELMLAKTHVVRLESRPPNIEGQGEVKIRDLVRNSLRMRPDRIVVGECRSGEALDMLQAMNTGHDGSLTTLHANTPRDALSRLETLVMMAGYDLPVKAIREQIASAVDLVVQTARLRDGSRKVMAITEIVGMEGEVVTMQDIVQFHQQGINEDSKVIGQFQYTGVQPLALRKFDEMGINYDIRSLSAMPSAGNLW